ncbi:hypothetical protein FBUS_02118 [Fasciolopsis buskii]|uniref:Uncharacterized protein n=1 Tax=Fasciolopsis buskii TaxID=27845 RepID=A0A8E0S2G0_9TREM|nr:hypothetical protein FBUS_02118 [Fasciolopsis buski]
MTELNVSELGISKNLLQMNFMRRTLVAKESATPITVADLLPNAEEYAFEVPTEIKSQLSKAAVRVRNRPQVEQGCSLFRIYRTPAGFRQSFGGFNQILENPSKVAEASDRQAISTFPVRNRFADLEADFDSDQQPKPPRSASLRLTLCELYSNHVESYFVVVLFTIVAIFWFTLGSLMAGISFSYVCSFV